MENLPAFLSGCDVLVCLLPLTPETQGILSAATFSQLPHGACVVNAARGGHLVGADLLASLDSGHLAAAILDVTDPEPPPPENPLRNHPRVWLTPHIASSTTPQSGAEAVLRQSRPPCARPAADRAGRPRPRLLRDRRTRHYAGNRDWLRSLPVTPRR